MPIHSRASGALGAAALGLALGGCVTLPAGPSVVVLPRDGVDFDRFQADDDLCRGFAGRSVGVSPQRIAEEQTVAGAAVGTAVGAAAGAAIGAAAGAAGAGAAVGAGTGLLLGTATGAARADAEGYAAQTRYDGAYVQCMYAKGHQVPVPAGSAPSIAAAPSGGARPYGPPAPARRSPPPPPPRGAPPPPPPGVY